MKRFREILLLTAVFLLASGSLLYSAESGKDHNKLFYEGNVYYEKRDYVKAIEEYLKVLDAGFESGALYYNIGNSFFKLGKLGYAILSYEKARRFMPQDSDLKSNLAYAKTLAGAVSAEDSENPAAKLIKRPFRDLNLNALAGSAAFFYLIMVLMFILAAANPFFMRKLRFLSAAMFMLFVMAGAAFGVRYYSEEILKQGVIVQKDVETKYEPIDKSTTYYTLAEGSDVQILKTRNGWCQVRRPDGKIGWVKKEAVEEVR